MFGVDECFASGKPEDLYQIISGLTHLRPRAGNSILTAQPIIDANVNDGLLIDLSLLHKAIWLVKNV